MVVHHRPPSPSRIRIAASGEQIKIALGPGTTTAEEVLLDFYDGQPPQGPGWWLGCNGGYHLPWPAGTSVWSTQDHATWPVEITLTGGHPDEMLYVQGPFLRGQAPTLESLVGAGMTLVGRAQFTGVHGAIESIELRYSHDGCEWHQWRYLVPLTKDLVVLVTAQASSGGYQSMQMLGQTMATEVR